MKSDPQRKYDFLYVAILMGVALALGTYLIATCVLISPDGTFYIRRAQELARGVPGAASTFPPGYPFLLAAAHMLARLFTQSDSIMLWVYSSQAVTLLCRILALVPLYFLGKLLTDARRSFWAVLILIFLPYPAHYGSDVLREWPFLLFLALGFWLLLRALHSRVWWMFGLVGLAAGLGYLIRPECGQLVIYGAIGLVIASVSLREMRASKALAAGVWLVACFLIPTLPYLLASGTIIPHQLKSSASGRPPAITSVGGRSASDDPLEFDISTGGLLEMSIEASDPDGDHVTFSVAAVPIGSRPVYRFRSATGHDCLWTISEREKDSLLAAYARNAPHYEGIAFYAFARAHDAEGLEPVYRLWSPVHERHFYTISESERKAVMEGTPTDQWQSEGIAFYAFPPDGPPPETKPVYRFRSASGAHFWTLNKAEAATWRPSRTEPDGIAWHAYGAGAAPAGLTLESAVLRWQPGPDQQGEHQLNIIVGDGQLQSCQLVRIRVGAAERKRTAHAALIPAETGAGPIVFWKALYEIGGAFGANLMYVLLIPLGLGLYRYVKDEAGPYERALTAAVIVVNIALMVGRYVWVDSGSARRYCLALVALAVFHVPKGVEIMARWLHVFLDFVCRRQVSRYAPDWLLFYLLVALGIGPLCLPKLLRPINADKRSYREVIRWLRDNTKADDVIAIPDQRLSFYAERQGQAYGQHADPRKVNYIVAIVAEDGGESVPSGWREEYSLVADARRRTRFIVYQTP